jgi:hypothetical protein
MEEWKYGKMGDRRTEDRSRKHEIWKTRKKEDFTARLSRAPAGLADFLEAQTKPIISRRFTLLNKICLAGLSFS